MSTVAITINRLKMIAPRIFDLNMPFAVEAAAFGPGCHEAEINEIEGLSLFPPDYREFLLSCRRIDAADMFNGYFIFSPISVAATDGPRRLHVGLGSGLDEVEVIPIGRDGAGNLFLMGRTPNANGTIWKWDHEHPARFDRVAREGLLLVATSFSGFLERVADDWGHFVAGDRDWPYISG